MTEYRFEAEPYDLEFDPKTTALLMIDMQRDFVEQGGFGEMLGNGVSLLRSAIEPYRRVLEKVREKGLFVATRARAIARIWLTPNLRNSSAAS